MKRITILAPAKINLFFKILNRRKDGYHNIETVFEKISLFDKILIKEIPGDDIIIESNSKDLSFSDKNNTVYQAIYLIKKKFRINRGLYVYVEKNIPVAAGLGGGSSDAAATLKGLNRLWGLGLPNRTLLNFSKRIGSDVPLFALKGNFLLGKGKGELLSRISGVNNLKLWHILIVPNIRISTPCAYSLFDKHYFAKKRESKSIKYQRKLGLTMPLYSANIILHALLNRDVSLLNYYSYNSFEDLITREHVELARFKRVLEDVTGDFVHMSGSGSALFMTFSRRKEAEYLIGKAKKVINRCRIFLVNTLDC